MSTKFQYSSYGNSIDGTSYCSGVETLAENLIEDNEEDALIVFPSKDDWAGLRSSSYRMTTENCEAILPLPIYKIKSIFLDVSKFQVTINNSTFYPLKYFVHPTTNEPFPSSLDITKFVLNKKDWEALLRADPESTDAIPNYCKDVYKDNTFYWDQGSNVIPFLSTVYPVKDGFIDIWPDKTPTYERLLRSAIYQKNQEAGASYRYPNEMGGTIANLHECLISGRQLKPSVVDWCFRVEYVPISTKTKVRARKAAKTREEYIQPYNQRAEINAVSAFGKNMYLTAQKTGVKELVLVKRYTRLADIPPLGTVLKQGEKTYRLVANNYKITNTIYVEVTHVYSENWSRKSQHVSVDQKYRNWKIPQDILWRNLYREDYLICSTNNVTPRVPSKLSVDLATRLFLCGDTSEDKTIEDLCWYPNASKSGVTVPCATYGTANSMVISATFKDNLSAGLSRNNDLCEESFYCNEDGTLERAAVVLTSGLNINSLASYPKISSTSNAPIDELYRDTYKIYKDAGEALKYTYQVHIVPDQADLGTIVIGETFAELSPLVKEWGPSRQLKIVFSERPIRDGEKIVNGYEYIQDGNSPYFNYIAGEDRSVLRLLDQATGFLENNKQYVAWAICDCSNRLLLGCNDTTKSTVYFTMAHKR